MTRDTSRDGWSNKLETRILTRNQRVWSFVERVPALKRKVNTSLIDKAALRLPSRPLPLSTRDSYTSWDSLMDRSYSSRHLPPVTRQQQPATDKVTELFRRGEETLLCTKSSVLFPYFVQWFIDGILRIDPADPRRNTSSHQIDGNQLYGLTPEMTAVLRSHEDGMLASEIIDGAEFPRLLCDGNGEIKDEFTCLRPARFEQIPPENRGHLFAVGSDRGNVHLGPMMFTTLFLREHNRIARLLKSEHPGWDDERLFQTARNVVIAMLTKLVMDEYINHITPYHFNFKLDPPAFRSQAWLRENWMAIEFNLLYRWHPMLPSTLRIAGKDVPLVETMYTGKHLLEHGLGPNFAFASQQRAGRVALFNTDPVLLPVESLSIDTGRSVGLASYNDYRELCGFPRATRFEQLSSDAGVCRALREVYGGVDELEFYPGLFAEDPRPGSVIPSLLGRIVGSDAFSQIITNPLLAPGVFGPQTFSSLGMSIFDSTNSLAQLVNRNVPEERKGRRFHTSLAKPHGRLSYIA